MNRKNNILYLFLSKLIEGIFVICLLSVVSLPLTPNPWPLTPALAESVTSGDVKLDYVIPGGGSKLGPESGGVLLYDLKGQPVIGESTSGTVTGQWGFGYLWTALVPVEGPAGTIPLTITRDNTDIVLSWTAPFNNIDLYVLASDAGTGLFTNNPGEEYWRKVDFESESASFALDGPNKRVRHIGQVGQGIPEVYYKALQPGVERLGASTDPDYLGQPYLQTAWAVGKMNVTFTANQFKLINVPFSMSPNTITQVIGNQLTDATLLYNDNGLTQIVLHSGNWDTNLPIGLATGYWLKSDSGDKVCTFVGDVIHETFSKNLVVGFDLYGYPLPKQVRLTTSGITPIYGDVMLIDRNGLTQHAYTDQWDSDFTIDAYEGYWYQNNQASPARFLEATP